MITDSVPDKVFDNQAAEKGWPVREFERGGVKLKEYVCPNWEPCVGKVMWVRPPMDKCFVDERPNPILHLSMSMSVPMWEEECRRCLEIYFDGWAAAGFPYIHPLEAQSVSSSLDGIDHS